jgi:hypothetical protein
MPSAAVTGAHLAPGNTRLRQLARLFHNLPAQIYDSHVSAQDLWPEDLSPEDRAWALQRQFPPSVAETRRKLKIIGASLLLLGIFIVLIALFIFLTQGSQVRVTATVLSERCHQVTEADEVTVDTRCDASVRFTTQSGRAIRTMITDAFPYEFNYRPGLPTTIQLRYFTSDPTAPMKQSNYMSVGEFLALLGFGALATTAGVALLGRQTRFAERHVRRYGG